MNKPKKKNKLGLLLLVISILLLLAHLIVPTHLEKSRNQLIPGEQVSYSQTTIDYHNSLTIMDWHADTTLWSRDLLSEADYGHVDVPRMQQGNVAIQMFTNTIYINK